MKKNPLDVRLLVPRVLVRCFPPSFLLNALTGPSGKSTFLHYMLLRLLSSGQSVVFCPHRIYYVFTSSGVYTPKGNTEGVFKNPIYNGVPALIDAQHTSALQAFSGPIMKVYILFWPHPLGIKLPRHSSSKDMRPPSFRKPLLVRKPLLCEFFFYCCRLLSDFQAGGKSDMELQRLRAGKGS